MKMSAAVKKYGRFQQPLPLLKFIYCRERKAARASVPERRLAGRARAGVGEDGGGSEKN